MCISCPRRSEELQIVKRYYGGLGIEPTYSSTATSTLPLQLSRPHAQCLDCVLFICLDFPLSSQTNQIWTLECHQLDLIPRFIEHPSVIKR